MKLIGRPLHGVKILRPRVFEDERGNFVKPFHEGQLGEHGISMNVKEEFFSTSAAGVLRGMHFQIPPHAHQKIVYCLAGCVLRRGALAADALVQVGVENHELHIVQ